MYLVCSVLVVLVLLSALALVVRFVLFACVGGVEPDLACTPPAAHVMNPSTWHQPLEHMPSHIQSHSHRSFCTVPPSLYVLVRACVCACTRERVWQHRGGRMLTGGIFFLPLRLHASIRAAPLPARPWECTPTTTSSQRLSSSSSSSSSEQCPTFTARSPPCLASLHPFRLQFIE